MELLDHEANAPQQDAIATPNASEFDAVESQSVEMNDVEETKDETVETSIAEEETAPATKESLLTRLAEIAALEPEQIDADAVSRIKQQFYYLHNDALHTAREAFIAAGNAPEAFVPQPDEAEAQLKALLAQVKEKKATLRAQIEAQQLRNLELKEAVIAELNQMSADTDNVNRHYPRAKELQAQFKEIGEVAQEKSTEIWKAFQEAVEHFYDQWKVNKELRDYDFKKNLAEKQLLIDEATRLDQEPDVITAFKRLQDLHEKWREIGPVAKEYRESIWATFKDVSAVVNKKYQAFFEERKKREQENEEAKTRLCELIEAIDLDSLNGYSAWNKATQQIIQAQEEWKTLGYASRRANNTLFARFRHTIDRFFAAKAQYFQTLKDEQSTNLQAKIALCEQAEALKDSTDWKQTTQKLVELQKQWKTIGAVAKKQSDQVWARFMAACDHFFQQKKESNAGTRKTEQTNLATKRAIVDELTALNTPEATTPRDEAIARIHQLRAQWQETGHVPFREKDRLHDAYREVVRQLFDKYDIHENRARQASFEANINDISSDKQKLSRERERLMRAYEARRNELKTYENNLGFFNSRTRGGDQMLKELERKIQHLRADIADLEQKIDLVTSKM